VFVTDYSPPDDPKSRAKTGTERVLCLDEKTGEILWTQAYPAVYTMDYRAGPRATPTVDGERVYTLGAEGDLSCLDVNTGKRLWSKHFADAGAKTPTWGYAAHPLVDGNKLICLTGPAREGKVVTAFDKMTGDVLWTALKASDIGYSPQRSSRPAPPSPAATAMRDRGSSSSGTRNPSTRSTPKRKAQLDAAVRPGALRRLHRHATTDSRGIRRRPAAHLLVVGRCDDAEARRPGGQSVVLWQRAGKGRTTTGGLHVLMAPPAVTPSHIFGVSNGGEMRCLQAMTGDVVWETYAATSGDEFANWSTAFIVPNPTPDHSLLFNEHGEMILARLSGEGYKELGRTKLIEPTNQDAGRRCCGVIPRWPTAASSGATTARSFASSCPMESNPNTPRTPPAAPKRTRAGRLPRTRRPRRFLTRRPAARRS
jgi:hypothetical protein